MSKRRLGDGDESDRGAKRRRLGSGDNDDGLAEQDWGAFIPDPVTKPAPKSRLSKVIGELLRPQADPCWTRLTPFPPELVALCNAYLGTWACTPAELQTTLTGLVDETKDDPYARADIYLAVAMHYDHSLEVEPALVPSEVTVALDRCLPLKGVVVVGGTQSWAHRSFDSQPSHNYWPCLRRRVETTCLSTLEYRDGEAIPLADAACDVAIRIARMWQCHVAWDSPTADLIADTLMSLHKRGYVTIDLRVGTVTRDD